LTSLYGGPKAAGGPVSSGRSYLVGEEGPELFTPGRAGHITPNTGGGGQTIVFAPRIDARGSDAGAIAKLEGRLNMMQRDFARNVKSSVTHEQSRNPGFARS
jgi:phage-related minor tail protein